MSELLIGGYQHFVARSLGTVEEFAIVEVGPTHLKGGIDLVR